MKKYSLAFSFIVATFFGFSQQIIVEPELPQQNSVLTQVDQLPTEGTYQIVVGNKNIVVNIPTSTLYQVNSERHSENVVYIEINENVIIKILPFSVIRASNFIPVKMYSYEN